MKNTQKLIDALKSIPEEATVVVEEEDIYTGETTPARYVCQSYDPMSEIHQLMIDTCLDDNLDMDPIVALELTENGFDVNIIHESAWEAAIQITIPGSMNPPLIVIAIV